MIIYIAIVTLVFTGAVAIVMREPSAARTDRQRGAWHYTDVALWANGAALGALAVYLALHSVPAAVVAPAPTSVATPPVPRGHTPADFDRMLLELNDRIAKNPKDVDSRVLLGRTLASVERWQEAKEAFAQAIALLPDEPALHAQMGEVLTLEAGGTVTAEARAEFAKAPDDPRSRYYLAVEMAQRGDIQSARAKLRALADEAPPDAAWRQLVLDELKALEGPARQQDAPAKP